MSTTRLHLLQVTDSASEAASVARFLEPATGDLHSEYVANPELLQAALAKGNWHWSSLTCGPIH